MIWDKNCNEMNILCTDARVPERECRVVIESDRVPVWIPFPTSGLWFEGRAFGATRTAGAPRWTASTWCSVVMCLCHETVNQLLPVLWKWLTLAAVVPEQLGIGRLTIGLHIYGIYVAVQRGLTKDKSYRSKVWWQRLRRWEQSVCCVGDAPPRWPWPWKMTDAFDDSLESVFKRNFCSRERLYSPWRSERGRLWLFDRRRGCALQLLSRRERLKE